MNPLEKPTSRMVVGYMIGFLASLLLTLGAYAVATGASLGLSMNVLAFLLLSLAVLQLLFQLRFFLHVGSETGPKWHSLSFVFTVIMLLIVVVGSLWVMFNLNYRMGMSSEQMNQYMIEQNKKGF